MDKIKQGGVGKFLSILKCCMVGLIVTLVGIVLFAVVLKFADLSSNVIGYINDVIKAVSIFVIVFCMRRKAEGKLILNSFFAGIIYSILSLLVFSILNGKFSLNLSIVYDLLFSVIVALIVAIMVNLMSRKN